MDPANDLETCFDKFVKELSNGKHSQRRCLLLARDNDEMLCVVSGFQEFEEHFSWSYKNYLRLRNMAVATVAGVLKALKNLYVVPLKSNRSILAQRIENGRKKLVPLKKASPGFDIRDYTCCERKLFAYLENDRMAFEKLNYIVCRYPPCGRCTWLMENYPRLYRCAGDGSGVWKVTVLKCLNNKASNLLSACLAGSGITSKVENGCVYLEEKQ